MIQELKQQIVTFETLKRSEEEKVLNNHDKYDLLAEKLVASRK